MHRCQQATCTTRGATPAYTSLVSSPMNTVSISEASTCRRPVVSSPVILVCRWGRAHQGLDIKVYIGDTIRAAWSGKVRVVKYDARGYGKYVVIRHPNGLETYYGHMSKQLVSANEYVKAGQPIGLGGNTGRSTGSHLHFETRLCGHALNPALFFDFPNQDITATSTPIIRAMPPASRLALLHSVVRPPAVVIAARTSRVMARAPATTAAVG